MPNRVQTLRSSAPGVLPQAGTRQPGELWLNFADFALGFIDAAQTAQKLLAVRWFVPTTSYAVGDFVLNGGNLYRAIAPSAPGTFVAANWSKVGTAADLTAMQAYVDAGDAARLPLVGGTLTGALMLAADPSAALGAATKQYVDARLPLAGGTMTGPLILSGPPTQNLQAATKAYVDSGAFLPIGGGTLTGPLTLAADPAAPLQAATAEYADRPRYGDNRLINGDMRVDQRNNGASGTAQGYTVDRWFYAGSNAGRFAWQRQAAGPTAFGFPYTWATTSQSAYALLAADYFFLQQPIEADMVSDFAWGTPNAQPVTLSFWVQSSLTGTYGGSIQNYATTRSYPFTYSIPAANTWTKIVVTNIPGDTAGAWVMSGNGGSVCVNFGLGVGTTYSGPAGAWASANYYSATSAVSVVSTNGARFYVTGVKLEIGSVATPFNRQSMAKSLVDCQRYYQVHGLIVWGYQASGAIVYNELLLPVAMRAAPSVAFSNISYASASALTNNSSATTNVVNQITASVTAGVYAQAAMALSAEL